MNFRRCLLCLSVLTIIHLVALFYIFHDKIVYLKFLTATSISISNPLSDQERIISELKEMWQEQLIEDLFKARSNAPLTFTKPKEMEKQAGDESTVDVEAREVKLTKEDNSAARREGDAVEIIEDADITDLKGVAEYDDVTTHNDAQTSGEAEMPNNKQTLAKQTTSVQEAIESNSAIAHEIKTSENSLNGEKQIVNGENQSSAFVRDSPKMVLILTESRHGSTWLMDLISYGDNAIPVFEPLISDFLKMYALDEKVRQEYLAKGYDPVTCSDWREVILAKICLCDWQNKKILGKTGKVFPSISIRGLGYKSKRFNITSHEAYHESIEICDKKNALLVPKTIRLYNISNLYLLREFGCDSFKIIHLVRDPRAVLNSRMKVFHELYDGNKLLGAHIMSKLGQAAFNESYMRQAAGDLCSHHLHNHQIGMHPPPWLEGRYTMVRYEDLAEKPEHWARQLLHYVRVSYTKRYKEYVYNTTHIKERGLKDKGNYGVDKESSEIVNSWRNKLIESHWRLIEIVCADMMKVFGYKPDFLMSED